MVTSEHIHASLDEVENRWSLMDLYKANATLDALEDFQVGNMPKPPRGGK